MNCPFCGGEMITGEVVCKTASGPTIHPRRPEDSDRKYALKVFFGNKDAISTHVLEEGWHCPACEKTLIVWGKNERNKRRSS